MVFHLIKGQEVLTVATLCAQSLSKILTALVQQPSWETLTRLFLFPRYVLAALSHGGRRASIQARQRVADRAFQIVSLPLSSIWETVQESASSSERRSARRKKPPVKRRLDFSPGSGGEPDTLSEDTIRSVRALVEEGALSKAVKRLASEGFHDPNDLEVLKRLRALHPAGCSTLPPEPVLRSAKNSAEEEWLATDYESRINQVRQCVLSFPIGSGAGPSGLRPLHLREMLVDAEQEGCNHLMAALLEFVHRAWIGDLPPQVTQYICCARLFPLRKKDDGIRPVAVGEALRRLVEKTLSANSATKAVMEDLLPLQTGFMGKNVCEHVVFGLQALVRENPHHGKWGLLQVDISNAFNAIHRSNMLQGIAKRAPHLLPWAASSLVPACLFVGHHILESTEGAQQGAPLSPLFFALAIQEVIAELPPLSANVWYLDDGSLMGSIPQLEAALQLLVPKLDAQECQVNWRKTTVWGPGCVEALSLSDTALLKKAQLLPNSDFPGTKVLGCPVESPGSFSFTRDLAESAVGKQEVICQQLRLYPDCQIQHALLRHCLDACRLGNLLRSSDLFMHEDLLHRADSVIRSTLESIMGDSLPDHIWLQACLPLSQGGLGIRSPSMLAAPARMAGILAWISGGAELLGIKDASNRLPPSAGMLLDKISNLLGTNLEPIREWLDRKSISAVDGEKSSQRWWTAQVTRIVKERLTSQAVGRDAVRLAQSMGPVVTGWMSAPASQALGLRIDSSRYRSLLRWHLGLPLFPVHWAGVTCPLQCGEPMDPWGDHAVCCRRNKSWQRHLGIQTFISRCLQARGIPFHLEQSAMGDAKRDADILLPAWSGGAGLAIDVGVCHPCPPSALVRTSDQGTQLLLHRADRKRTKYGPRCASNGCRFEPLVISTWGQFAPACQAVWTELVRRLASHRTGASRSLAMTALHQGLSVALHIGVANQLTLMQHVRECGGIDAAGNLWGPAGNVSHQ